tara:strand:- start:3311 stop:3751 length:441 start_codon:yes stop_codon:yes gene_type:complete
MGTQTTSGITVSIGAAPATLDLAGFDAVVPVLIGEVTDFGELGKVFNTASYTALAGRAVVEKKTSYNRMHPSMSIAIDDDDQGQIDALAALETDDSYTIKVVRQDGSIKYVTAQITSFPTAFATDSFELGTIALLVQSDVVNKAAP